MTVRVRLMLGVLAAISALALMLQPTAPSSDGGGALDPVATTGRTATRATSSILSVRPVGYAPTASVAAGLAGVAAIPLLTAIAGFGLVGGRRRRLGDVGDDWRALLVGAPPARAS